MKRSLKRVLAAGLGAALCLSTVPVTALAQEAAAGTPYAADGTYNVSVPHVVVNQVFGASDDAEAVTHSFIELYNQSDAEVSLEGWYAYYKSSPDGGDTAWSSLALQGTIAAKGHFLIRCGQVDTVADGAWQIPAGDMEWNVQLYNKGVSVALFSQKAELTDTFAGAVTDANRPAGYVDVLAVQGNDGEAAQIPPVYEGGYEDIQSKKKAVRRDNFADTDDNAADASDLNYEDAKAEDAPVLNGKGETIAAQEPSAPAYEVKEDSFEEAARLTMQKAGGITLGTPNADGGVAEIVSFNADTNKAYVVNGQESVLNIFDVKADGSFGEAEKLNIQELMKAKDPAFAYGDMTSVAVDTETDRIAVALQDADYTKPGRIAVLNYENEIVSVYTAGVQPDMVAFAAGGRYILTADEGEPREGYGAGTSDPAGTVTVADTQTGEVRQAGFAAFGAEELAASGVLFNRVNGEILSAEFDLKKLPREEIKELMDRNLTFRKTVQPSLKEPNAGSVFKNPDNDSAGRLLDKAGVKNFDMPNVKVWQKHANFIVNKGNATSEDVLELMVKMFQAVKDTYTIELKPEVIFIGDKTKKEEELCNILYQKTQK